MIPGAASTPLPALVLVATSTPPPSATATATPQSGASPSGRPFETTQPGQPSVAAATATAAAQLLDGPHTTYVVQAGDTLTAIARRYGVPVGALAALNHLAPPYRIIQGKPLLVPAA